MSDPHNTLTRPHPVSSLAFAHKKADQSQRNALNALYTLHTKWREAAVYDDPHQAITTLNWWHHELEKAQRGEISHPALLVLKDPLQESSFFDALQGLLHGHMHWHHLTRIETLAQLEPIIESISASYVSAWQFLTNNVINQDLSRVAGASLWWVDQTRHIGHRLTPSRLWLPMSWLKKLNLPAHLLFNRKNSHTERAQQGAALVQKLTHTAESALIQYQTMYHALPKSAQKSNKPLHALIQQRRLLLDEIKQQPQEVWIGLVSVSPRRKWWATKFL